MSHIECGATVNIFGFHFDSTTDINCISDQDESHWHDEQDAKESGCEEDQKVCCHHFPPSNEELGIPDGYWV